MDPFQTKFHNFDIKNDTGVDPQTTVYFEIKRVTGVFTGVFTGVSLGSHWGLTGVSLGYHWGITGVSLDTQGFGRRLQRRILKMMRFYTQLARLK